MSEMQSRFETVRVGLLRVRELIFVSKFLFLWDVSNKQITRLSASEDFFFPRAGRFKLSGPET